MNAGRTDHTSDARAKDSDAREEDPLLHPARAKDGPPAAADGGKAGRPQDADQPQAGAPATPQAKKLQDRIDDSIGAAGAGPAA